MKNVGYYNGEVGLLEELKVPFLDRVSFYGDGVYDATMALDGVVVFSEDHIERFFNSCKNMEIDPGITKEDLLELLTSLVANVTATTSSCTGRLPVAPLRAITHSPVESRTCG